MHVEGSELKLVYEARIVHLVDSAGEDVMPQIQVSYENRHPSSFTCVQSKLDDLNTLCRRSIMRDYISQV